MPGDLFLRELEEVLKRCEHQMKKRLRDLENQLSTWKLFQSKIKQYGSLAARIGLRLDSRTERLDEIDFHRFDCDAASRKRFDALPQGAYQLLFLTSQSGHSIDYYKCASGSYLFDSNLGWMKCPSQSPGRSEEAPSKISWQPQVPK
jgi:hypothetical protein